jgi:hypothetical protein
MEVLSTASATVNLARSTLAARPRIARWIKPELRPFNFPDQSHLSQSQATDIDAFLRSEPVAALVRIMTIMLLTEEGALDDHRSLDTLQPAFTAIAKKWNVDKPDNWSDLVPQVWSHVNDTLRQNLPRTAALLEEDEDSSLFSQFIASPLSSSRNGYSRFHRMLLDLAGQLEALSDATALAREIAEAARVGRPTLFTHLDIELANIDRAKLYIYRARCKRRIEKRGNLVKRTVRATSVQTGLARQSRSWKVDTCRAFGAVKAECAAWIRMLHHRSMSGVRLELLRTVDPRSNLAHSTKRLWIAERVGIGCRIDFIAW